MKSYVVFDRYASEYDSWYRRNAYAWASECLCLKLLGLKGVVLDIGVGTGAFRSCVEGFVIGIDPALNPLTIARNRGVEPVNAFGEALPLRSESVDWIAIVVTICFVDRPLDVLKEAYRVLKRGGYLALCFVPRDSAWGRHYLSKAWRGSRFYSVAKLYSYEEVVAMVTEAGFSYVETVETLCVDPYAPTSIEMPRRGYSGCGFACVKAVKR